MKSISKPSGQDATSADSGVLALTADIVAAHVASNRVSASDVASLIANVHGALRDLRGAASTPAEPAAPLGKPKPAVSIRRSIQPEHLICLEDGKKVVMLKRYLQTNFQMTPEAYRTKWRLPTDYPMVAPNHSQKQRATALRIGLGRNPAAPRTRTRRTNVAP